MSYCRFLLFALLVASAAGCTSPKPAPIIEASPNVHVGEEDGYYIVRAGDTVFAIAYLHSLKIEDFTRLNRLKPPYTIFPGQRLKVRGAVTVSENSSSSEAIITASSEYNSGSAVAESTIETQSGPVSSTEPEIQTKPIQSAQSLPTPSTPSSTARIPPKVVAPKRDEKQKKGWQWPVPDQPISNFTSKSKGLDYILAPGTPIRAAASGLVVYAGPGLDGFKYLVIIKQSDVYLSAYGFNAPLELTEGSDIQRGDVLTTVEAGSAAGQKFHFEVRRDGNAVDPKKIIR